MLSFWFENWKTRACNQYTTTEYGPRSRRRRRGHTYDTYDMYQCSNTCCAVLHLIL